MTPAARSLWKVLGIAALCLIGYIIKSAKGGEDPKTAAFLTIFNLTPAELQAQCGSPDRDVAGVLSANDGSRDLYYHDRYDSKIAFRFVSGSSTWESLGAWTETAFDPVGIPLDNLTTLERLPCVRRERAVSNLVFLNLQQAMSISLAFAEPAVRDQIELRLGLLQRITPPVPIGPQVPIGPGPQVPIGPGPSVPIGPGPSVPIGPRVPDSAAGTGGGDGGPPDTAMPRTTIVIPCPPHAFPCNVIDAAKFISDLKQAIAAGKENDFEKITDWLNWITRHDNVIIQLPELEVDRVEVIKQIFQLHAQCINMVTARLRDDMTKLQPFQWDSAEDTQRKLEVVMRADRERKELWRAAAEEARNSSDSSSDSSPTGSSLRFQSKAYQQAVQIHLTGSWGSN